ncbi:Sterol uptake protein 2 [Candida viswanathii]|uniref:Sterol uptake protein 2 n=1 Tax=Candida viswanathii TaxID=5486 RepID=A0A367YH86_9ASCO|nr:Sterol uptake protein 2 [Candida viswanathii]
MSDLLIHSIMHHNHNHIHSQPHKQSTPSLPSSATVLPPISSIISSTSQPTILPPLTPPSTTASSPSYLHQYHYHQPTGLVTPPSKTYSLTESNLSKFETSRNCHGLGLLSSAVLFDEQQQAKQLLAKQSQPTQKPLTTTQPPSLTSRSSSVSSYSTPTTPEFTHREHNLASKKQASATPPPVLTKTTTKSNATTTITTITTNAQPKRRQRLGPSCDSCRLRKVKCDAEISIVSPAELQLSAYAHLDLTSLSSGAVASLNLHDEGYVLLYTADKYVRFKSCKHCRCKLNVTCSFKNGYFKKKRA